MSAIGYSKASTPSDRWSLRRRVWMYGLCIVVGLIMAAVIGEAALRLGGYSPVYINPLSAFHVAHDLVGYQGKPNFTGRFHRLDFDVVISHNENGFRRQEYQNAGKEIRHRALVFGDSFTWGWGVGQAKVLTDQMSRLMPEYRILNFGLNGSGTLQQFTLFEAYGKELLQPDDTLVLMFNGNDFVDNLKGYLHAKLENGQVTQAGPSRKLRSKSGSYLKEASYLFNFVVFSAQLVKESIRQKHADKWAKKLLVWDDASPEIIVGKHFLAEFQKSIAQRQARFIVAYIPQQGELGESAGISETSAKNERALRRAFFACAGSLGIRTLDLLPHFLKAKKSGRYDRFTFPHDRHWNEHGHAVAAKALYEFIVADQNSEPNFNPPRSRS